MTTAQIARRRDRFACRWNAMDAKRRANFYYRWATHIDRIIEKLGLTGWCTACSALIDPRQYSHRDACPECGRHEIVTPYGG